MKIIISVSLIAAVLLSSCSSSKKSPAVIATEKSIAGINWYLKKIYLASGDIEVSNPDAYIKFDAAKNYAGGKGGCNSFGSNYTIDQQQLSFKNIFSTKMFCDQYQSEENSLFKQLELVNRYDVQKGRLLLFNGGTLLLEFQNQL